MDYETSTLNIDEASDAGTITLGLYDIFIPLLGIFIILLNLLIVISSGLLLEKRQQPRSCYMFLGNLALADMLTGIAVVFGHFAPARNDLSCAIQIGMIVSSTLIAVFSVLLVAIDRFLYILHGLLYQQYMFPNRVRFLIVIAWILGTIIGFLPAMSPSLRGNMTHEQCWFILVVPELVLATTIIGNIPILIVLILYSIILRSALKKVSELKHATSGYANTNLNATNGNRIDGDNNLRFFRGSALDVRQPQQQQQQLELHNDQDIAHEISDSSAWSMWWRRYCCCRCGKKTKITAVDAEGISITAATTMTTPKRQPSKWKAIKIVMFTTGSFVITWVPYLIACTMYVYCDHEGNPNFCNGLKIAIASPLAILGFANSLLNPIIYAWWHNGFRTNSARIYAKRLQHIKWCRWCYNKSNEIASSSSRTPRTTNLSSTSNLSSSAATTSTTSTNNVANDVNESRTAVSPHASNIVVAVADESTNL